MLYLHLLSGNHPGASCLIQCPAKADKRGRERTAITHVKDPLFINFFCSFKCQTSRERFLLGILPFSPSPK